jgi:serine phosphatase RsbU (regulator of sigma subunit)
VLPTARWPVHRLRLKASEGVLFYTDGLIEGRVSIGTEERFGATRLIDLLSLRGLAERPEELESVIAEIAHAGGGLPDDVAALILLPAARARTRRVPARGAAQRG